MHKTRGRQVEAAWGAIAIVVALGLAAIWAWWPAARPQLTLEHRAVEKATMWLFALTALVGAAAALRYRGRPRLAIALAVLGLLSAMEEASWVLRLGLTPPRLLDVQLDCFHDLVEVAYRFLLLPGSRPYLIIVAVLALVALLVALYLLIRHWPAVRRRLQEPPWRLLVISAGLLAVSVLLDFKLFDGKWRAFFEEMIELQAALALLFAALACWVDPGPRQPPDAEEMARRS